MRNIFWIIMSIMLLALTACGAAMSPEAIPTVSLGGGSSSPVTEEKSGDSVSAAAVIVPIAEARLSFTSIGRVTAVNVEVGDKVNAGEVLVQLDTTLLEAKVREAEANLLFAETDLYYLIRVIGCRGKDCTPSYKHIEVAENEVARANALVDVAKANLTMQSNLSAPFTGTVVSVEISPAETVSPGQVVIVLGDLSVYLVETTDLSERYIPRVKVGQEVKIFVEALGREISGSVSDISSISSTLGGDVVYKVTIDFDQQPQGVLWGMSADVEILVKE